MNILGNTLWTFEYLETAMKELLLQGFKIGGFEHFLNDKMSKKNLILRHDVDFDLDAAIRMAELERKTQIESTYFFRVCAKGYNLLSANGMRAIKTIEGYGHEIGLHLDVNMSKIWGGEEFDAAAKQCEIFSKLVDHQSYGFSIHMPTTQGGIDIADSIKEFFSLKYHSYEDRFTIEPFKYISDSMMIWREKSLIEVAKSANNIQLLIHPIWWYEDVPQYNF